MTDLLRSNEESGFMPDVDRSFTKPPVVDATRPSPLEWIRVRREARESRKAEAAHHKAAERMNALGHEWRVLDLQAAGADRKSFLAVGPGGVFAVTIKDHGRARVSFAG